MATTLFWVAYASAGSTPTGAQIVAGQNASGAAALASGSEAYTSAGTYDEATAITSLSPGTPYKVAWVAYDGTSYSTPVESGVITTGPSVALASTGAVGALSASANSPATAALTVSGIAGTFSGSANSTATAALAITGSVGSFSGAANSTTTAAASITGSVGAFSGGVGSGTTAALSATGIAGAFSGSANSTTTAAMSALGAEGAFAGSAYPLTSAQLAALGATGAFSGASSTVGTAALGATGLPGAFSGSTNSTTTATLAATGQAGTFSGSAFLQALAGLTATGAPGSFAGSASVSSGGTANPADVWNYVLSNGKTAEETVVEAHAMLVALSANAIADAVLNRDLAAGTDTNTRSLRNSIRFLRNRWNISGTTLTVMREDDSTPAWTATVTPSPGAAPISGTDPT